MVMHRLQMHLERRRRKRNALHMLMLSGVVRPSHIELRYTTLLTQAEEPTNNSQNSALSSAQSSNHLHRFISLLQRRFTQLLSLEPSHVKHSIFKSSRATTSRMCLRSLAKSECDSSLVPLP